MKCSWCKQSVCVCYDGTQLSMKSTLTPSATEFPDPNQIRRKSAKNSNSGKNILKNYDRRLSTESARVRSTFQARPVRFEQKVYPQIQEYLQHKDVLAGHSSCSSAFYSPRSLPENYLLDQRPSSDSLHCSAQSQQVRLGRNIYKVPLGCHLNNELNKTKTLHNESSRKNIQRDCNERSSKGAAVEGRKKVSVEFLMRSVRVFKHFVRE